MRLGALTGGNETASVTGFAIERNTPRIAYPVSVYFAACACRFYERIILRNCIRQAGRMMVDIDAQYLA